MHCIFLLIMVGIGFNFYNIVGCIQKLEPDSKDTICAQGDEAMVSPFTSIKLFGRTVLVTNCQKTSQPLDDSHNIYQYHLMSANNCLIFRHFPGNK